MIKNINDSVYMKSIKADILAIKADIYIDLCLEQQ